MLSRHLPSGGCRARPYIRIPSSSRIKLSFRQGSLKCTSFILSSPFWGVSSPGYYVASLWYETLRSIETEFCWQRHREYGAHIHLWYNRLWKMSFCSSFFPSGKVKLSIFWERLAVSGESQVPNPHEVTHVCCLTTEIVVAWRNYYCQLEQM